MFLFYIILTAIAGFISLVLLNEAFRQSMANTLNRSKWFLFIVAAIGLIITNLIGLQAAMQLLPMALGFAAQLLFGVMFMFVQFGAMMYFMSRARVYWIMPGESPVSFADYKGNPEVLELAQEVVEILKGSAHPNARKLGLNPIRGLLLEGPPGTGKSYLGQVIAGEAGVPFAYASSPSLQSAFMGMSAMTIWRLYGKANKLADRYGSCILFFDEIDAIGQSRSRQGPGMGMMGGMMFGGGGQILNELLTQMDPPPTTRGFFTKITNTFRRFLGLPVRKAERRNVLTIGATNLVKTLDPALLRPGRFDRHITVDYPTDVGRREIVDYYLAKYSYDLTEQEIQRFVRSTPRYTPVALKHIINEALIVAIRDKREALTFRDIQRAQETHEWGVKQPLLSMSDDEKRRIAYHEAGHAVAAVLLRKTMRVEKATIIRRGGALGLVGSKPLQETHTVTKDDMMQNIDVALASRAVEEEILKLQMSGFTGDLQQATTMAVTLISQFGMGSRLISYAALNMMTSPRVIEEAETVLAMRFRLVKEFIRRNEKAVHAIAEALLEQQDLDGPVVEQIVHEHAEFKPEVLHEALADLLEEDERLLLGNTFSEELRRKALEQDRMNPASVIINQKEGEGESNTPAGMEGHQATAEF